MAVARLSVGIGKKGKAAPHALYIAREEKYAKPDNDLEKLESKGHGNMPSWARDKPSFFWKMSDEHERKNGTTYREHVISLPRELNASQRRRLVTDWIVQELDYKHAYQYAIHNPPAVDGGEQPHVHLMFSERLIDGIDREPDLYFKRHNSAHPERGGAKKANTPKLSADRKAELLAQRGRWETLCNKHLENAGSDARINMKSLKEQGIEREPFNLTMKQIKSDRYESVYKELKQAERSSKFATEVVEDLIDVAAELKRLDALKLANSIFGNSSMQPPVPKPKPSQTDQHQKADAEPFVPIADIDKACEIYTKATATEWGIDDATYPDIRNLFNERQISILEDSELYGWTGRRLKDELLEQDNSAIIALLLDPKLEQEQHEKAQVTQQLKSAQQTLEKPTDVTDKAIEQPQQRPTMTRRRP